ncbi:MAG TPA: RIP metalloprotease RseP [Thermoanaerobaculia bacterium]|jgi:regulator of sigma E protease|nr:RIP metalloprotease RseP [Thermoanaerobaculia bacterium]
MTHLTDILTNILAFAFALGVIIVVHEAGHLMVAKAFGVRVLTFSVGFGKRIWGIRRGETEYRLSAIPLGGYVRLGGENPDEVSDDPREFLNKPRWQRILVYLAGPAMNVILAIVLFAALFMVGIEVMNLPDAPPLIGGVEEGSSAARAGLKRGDLILAVKGEPVDDWQDVGLALMGSPETAVPLTVRRDGQTLQASVTPRRVPKYDMGDFAGLLPSLRPQIIQVIAGQPAEAAGFRPGDEVRAVDGRPVMDSQAFVDAIARRPGQRTEVQVVRDGRPLVLAVTPRDQGGSGKIGVQIGFYQRYGPARAFVESVRYNIQTVRDTFKILGKIFSRELSPKGALAGPIEIAAQSGAAARNGFKYLLHLMGFISISIAIMNLMPIPILDGGQIFILMVEGVIRRDLSLRLKEIISQVGFVMILLLMFVVIWFDLVKNLPATLLPGS